MSGHVKQSDMTLCINEIDGCTRIDDVSSNNGFHMVTRCDFVCLFYDMRHIGRLSCTPFTRSKTDLDRDLDRYPKEGPVYSPIHC